MSESRKLAVTYCTVGTQEDARKMASHLLEKKAAACVSILPAVESHYVWEGRVEQAQEVLLLIKSDREDFAALEATIREVHPYECPEIVMVEACEVHEPYLKWAFDQIDKKNSPGV